MPVIMQLEMLECGAASLAMVLAYYSKWIPLEQVRVDCGISRDGSSAKNIVSAARSYGLEVQAYKIEPESLLEDGGPFPCIIHWGFNHFVVLDGFKGKQAVINDPAKGRITVSWEEFDKNFTGICLMLAPGESFEPSGKRKSAIDFVKERLHGSRKAVIFVVLTTLISSLLGIMTPVFSRIFLDRLLTGDSPHWFTPFILGLSLFTLIMIIVNWVNAIYRMKIQGKMAAVGESSYLWKVLRLPMQFFEQRIPGDIASRQDGSVTISNYIVNILGPLFVNTAAMIFYLVVMINYNAYMTLIGVGAIILNILVGALVTKKRTNILRVQLRDEGKLAGATVSGISMIETIKSSGAEKGFFGKWAGYQAGANAQRARTNQLEQYLGIVPTAVTSFANMAVMIIGVYLTIRGDFTPGMVMAFQGFLSSFMVPANSIINATQTMQTMVTQMERIDDVMKYPDDPAFNERPQQDNYEKLSGNIEISHVTFGYSRLGKPLIKDFSMSVKQGQRIAFVGRSGCGKSTLAKLLTGLYAPWEGSITFDGKKISEIDRNVFTGSIAVVDQDITLFDDTISENIKMWDSSIEDFEVIMAARDAGIHEDITLKEGGYQHKLLEGGRDMSGGQRQRLEIARALAQDPTICIMDEATSALDAKTENEVIKAIENRGITCIVIAHRLSTIRDCDEIIVLDGGEVVERGTHDELFAKGGAYTELVINE